MSDSEHSTMSYTSISSDFDPSSWGIPLMDADELPEMDPYEEVAQQGQAAPPSHAYVPDLIELEHHVPVYVSEHVYLEYLVPSDDDIPVEDLEEDPEEDPIDYTADADDDKDEEEESSKDDDDEEEEHLAPVDPIAVASPAVVLVLFAEETEPLETDESAAIPPPPPPVYRTTFRISVRTQTPIPFPSEVEVARLLSLPTPPPSLLTPLSSPLPYIPSPPLPLPSPPTHSSPTYTEAPLGYRAAKIQLRAASPLPSPTPSLPLLLPSTARRADIPEADIPPWKRLLLIAPTLRFEFGESSAIVAARHLGSTVDRRVDYSFVDTVDVSIRASERRTMAAIEVVNLRVVIRLMFVDGRARSSIYDIRMHRGSCCST
ncbi:hypothetical protein Tco_0506606 [Tanacetum coccineum]